MRKQGLPGKPMGFARRSKLLPLGDRRPVVKKVFTVTGELDLPGARVFTHYLKNLLDDLGLGDVRRYTDVPIQGEKDGLRYLNGIELFERFPIVDDNIQYIHALSVYPVIHKNDLLGIYHVLESDQGIDREYRGKVPNRNGDVDKHAVLLALSERNGKMRRNDRYDSIPFP
ncbi:MAG: hypothetical protein KKC05_02515 [Nanoarchaeota archaeon]|nr:hypothetical protein [Nanoarchaeota archaeon]